MASSINEANSAGVSSFGAWIVITQICAGDLPFSSPKPCHNQTDPLPKLTGRPQLFDAIWLPAGFATAALGPASGLGDGRLYLTEAFGFRGAFNHNWDPYWATSLFGGISFVRYDGVAKNESASSSISLIPVST
jgi:hypothetical protein